MPLRSEHAVLFEPISIGPKTLRNRFYQTPHCGFGSGMPKTTAAYRGLRAEGGWAAVNTQAASVSMSGDEAPFIMDQWWDDDDASSLSLMVEEAHRHGALAGIELHHPGAFAGRRVTRWHGLAPSCLPPEVGPPHLPPESPKEMDLTDILSVQQAFVDGAVRARETGFDIVYVYGGHGYLLAQFLSPFHNKRRDKYGGTFENRARMWLETLQLVRNAIGATCAIAVRLAADALGPFGIDLNETLRFVRMADDLVDLWDVNVGSNLNMSVDMGASRFFRQAWQLEWSGQIRMATAKPIVGVGRLTDPDRMAEIIRTGVWDIIGAARASIADPFLPAKIHDGRLEDIRECFGSNACTSRWAGGHLGCAQNATAGEEYRRGWHPERFAPISNPNQDVLVIGAGPAGMECSIVLAERGMRRIHLVDANSDVGGIMRWIPTLPGLAEWARFLNYRRTRLEKLRNIEVVLNVQLDSAMVRNYGADIVILATGARWATDGLTGLTHEPLIGLDSDLQHLVFTPEQLTAGLRPPECAKVVVYDAEGYFMGASLAQLLAEEGYEVDIVTPFDQIAPWCDQTFEGVSLRARLHELGVRMHRNTILRALELGAASGEGEFGTPLVFEYDALVLTTHRLPVNGLHANLAGDPEALAAAGIRGMYQIGDCVAPRLLADVVFDGHRLAREIDSPNPSQPQAHLRERVTASLDGTDSAMTASKPHNTTFSS